jgi:pyruvate dehydrogenase E1 component alpha subunit
VSQGVLLEAMNLAALWKVPVLFVCENNGYATTLTVSDSVAGTICGRASAFGIPSSTVDGMDAEAVYRATAEMVENARRGEGPSFLECTTYRFDAHHTWEHKARVRYRPAEEEASGRHRDPVEIAGARLATAEREAIDVAIEALLDEAVAFATASPSPDPSTALDYLYGSAVLP